MNRRGFTLVETTLALAITATVLAALATAIPTALDARRSAHARLDRATTLRAVLVHVDRELAGALGEGFAVGDGAQASLRFVGGADPGHQLAYRIEAGALVRRTTPRGAPPPDHGTAPTLLVPGVLAGRFEAFDGSDWHAAWHATSPPLALRVHLTLDDGSRLERVIAIATGKPVRST
jgi:prepilin-type N-terminal cleavage/methylation domain-containing protein